MNEKLRGHIELLENHGVPYSVVQLRRPAVRSKDVLEHANPESIVKTIMFKKKNGEVFSVSVCSHDLICYKKIKQLVGGRVSTLHPDAMRELGWEPGECSPISIPGPLYVDPTVFGHDEIHTGSGDLLHGLEFSPEVLKKIRNDMHIVDVRKD